MACLNRRAAPVTSDWDITALHAQMHVAPASVTSVSGSPVDCDDGVACTDDSCNEETDSCDNIANDANCDDGLFCNGEETCHVTLDCQAGTDPCDGEPCNENDDTCGGGAEVWMVFTANVTVPGVGTVTNEDIVAYNLGTGTWSLVFDGSDVGLSSLAINGMAALPDGDILLTFTAAGTVGGLSVDDSDIVRFTPTLLGPTTAGAFSFYFDGSDVGLSKNDEDVDAAGLTSSGGILLSTPGSLSVTGVSGDDEDVFEFWPTSLGSSTSGTFQMFLDLSAVGIAASADVIAVELVE